MGRPPLALGTAGAVTLRQGPDGKWHARTYFRDQDGERREIARWATTKAAASAAIKAAIRDRTDTGGTELSPDARVSILIDQWLAMVDGSERATNTKEAYRLAATNWIRPEVGALRIREVKVSTVDRVLKAITKTAGPGAAKTSRSVLSGMFGLAARHDAITANPVRDSEPIARPRKQPRALTRDEADRITDYLRTSQQALDLDLADLAEMMLATGCRIGEACAIRDSSLVLTERAGTLEVNATMIRVKGEGLVIQERPKTAAGWRVLALPSFAVEMIHRRAGELRLRAPDGVVFGSPKGMFRDPSNTADDMRTLLDGLDCAKCDYTGWTVVDGPRVRCRQGPFSWVTFHTFRRTVATRLDQGGMSARKIADQLGHERPSMTMDRYMGRQVVSVESATLLDR